VDDAVDVELALVGQAYCLKRTSCAALRARLVPPEEDGLTLRTAMPLEVGFTAIRDLEEVDDGERPFRRALLCHV